MAGWIELELVIDGDDWFEVAFDGGPLFVGGGVQEAVVLHALPPDGQAVHERDVVVYVDWVFFNGVTSTQTAWPSYSGCASNGVVEPVADSFMVLMWFGLIWFVVGR